MNAADVLADTGRPRGASCELLVDALLAHGEQGEGVTIEADGELHPKDPPLTTRLPDGTLMALEFRQPGEIGRWLLVPVSAEAGDTDA